MSIEAVQREIVEEFSLFDDWMDRYQYLIDLGRKLEPLTEEQMSEEHLLDGCQSRVWLIAGGDAERLQFRANSDAAIVSGLIALLLRVYSGQPARDIVASKPKFVTEIGLSEHLSPTRANGLDAMLNAIQRHARRALAETN